MGQIAIDVGGHGAGRFVPPVAVLFQGLHGDPVQFAAVRSAERARIDPACAGNGGKQIGPQRADLRTRPQRLHFANHTPHFVEPRCPQDLFVERGRAGQQFVQQDSERIDVAPRVHVQAAQLRLLGRHVQGRADHLPVGREQRPVGQLLVQGFRDAEIDHFHDGLVVVQRDHDVGRLEIAMDDPFLVRVLHRPADIDKQLQTLARREHLLVTVIRDGHSAHQLHDEIRSARLRCPGIQHLRDMGVIHQGQYLPLGFEPGDHLLRVHARLDDLQGHFAADRLHLLGHKDHAESPFADLLK